MDVMTLLNSALAGRYTLQKEIGKGGMATVYLARDMRHNRNVALKLLDPELGAVLGAERFLSEIRVTANLQHPNLLPLFDSGEADGLLFYVMPYVEGESLRARLDREKQLPVDEAVSIATAVASALDYAHRHGVIHRDLKPENILLHEGEPLVADFGIALAISNAGGARVTQTGLSLGTPQYMSPEQATGDRAIDGRTDIYSLGALTYEMLTGEPPHEGKTAQAIIAKLMTEEPRPISVLRRSVPQHVDDAVECALEKLPADRFATAKAFGDAMSGKVAGIATKSRRTITGRQDSRIARLLPWGLTALVAAGAIALFMSRRVADPLPVRFKVDLGRRNSLIDVPGTSVAISPDGRTLAYIGRSDQARMIFLHRLDELESRPLAGTALASDVEFSRDGRWLSYWGENQIIYRIPVDGGAPTRIAYAGGIDGTSWGNGDDFVFITRDTMWRVSKIGSAPVRITSLDSAGGELSISDPFVLPDGNDIVFTVRVGAASGGGVTRLGVISMTGDHRTVLDLTGANAIGYLDGRLIYGRADGTIAAVRFDAKRRRVDGDPVSVVEGVLSKSNGGGGASVSRSGTLVFIRGQSESSLTILDSSGKPIGEIGEPRIYNTPVWSPDGTRIAVIIYGGPSGPGSNVWVYDLRSRAFSRLTSRAEAIRPSWTADGKRIAFVNSTVTNSNLWWVPADGSHTEELFFEMPGERLREVTFAPNGDYALVRLDPKPGMTTARDIWMIQLKGERKPVPVVQSPFNDLQPAISPNGRWVAYQSDETGRYEAYVHPLPGPGGRVQISQGGGSEVRWSPDGTRIVYRAPYAFRAVVVANDGEAMTITRHDSLFPDTYRRSEISRQNYDISRDGRFVVVREASEGADVIVVANWLTELRTKLRAH